MGEKPKSTDKVKTKSSTEREDDKPNAKVEGKKATSSSAASGKKSSRNLAAPKSSKKLGAVASPPTKKKQDDIGDDNKDKKKKPNRENETSKDEAKKSTSKKDEGDRKKKSSNEKKVDKKKDEVKKETTRKEKTKDKEKKKDKEAKKVKKSVSEDGKKVMKDKKKTKSDKKEKEVDKKSSKDDDNKKKKTLVCCICKDKSIKDDLAGGLCDHVFCTPCLENLLHKPMLDPQPDDNHLAAPTMGRCPECRAALKKFEMKDMASNGKKKKGSSLGVEKFKADKITDLSQTPIKGLVFQPDDDSRQLAYFHFDSDNDKKKNKIRPRLDFTKAISQDKEAWLMNDGTTIPEQKYFEKGYFYVESTRTFHGTIRWDTITFQGSHQWDCIIGFNKSFSGIHVGVIHERKERILDKKAQEKAENANDTDAYRYYYPFDGRWKLLWKNAEGKDQTGSITVRNNEFQQGPYLFNLNFKDPETPRFRWPLDPVYAAVKRGGSLRKKPMGPDIGERIVWETTHPAFSEITWERETIGDPPLQKTTHFGVGNNEYSVWTSYAEEARGGEDDTRDAADLERGSDESDSAEDADEKENESGRDSSSSSGSSEDDGDSDDDDDDSSNSSSS
jgi:hypothetical protein